MEITEVKVFPVQEEKLKAFVSIVLDECFMVNDIKIIRGRDGLFISMPSRRKKNGKFKDVAHPLNNETRQRIEGLVLGEYERLTGQADDRREQEAASASEDSETRPVAPEPQPESSEPDMPPPVVEPVEQPAPAAMAASAEEPAGRQEAAEAEEPSLEEVAELHLRDSFWTT